MSKRFALVAVLSLAACRAELDVGIGATAKPAPAKYVERVYDVAPLDLGPTPCDGCGWDIQLVDPKAKSHDMALNGRIVILGFNARQPVLSVIVIGPLVLRDTRAPDASVLKTYQPDKVQDMPLGEECVFWFSPYSQLTLRWEIRVVDGSKHVVLSGSWYRKTYANARMS